MRFCFLKTLQFKKEKACTEQLARQEPRHKNRKDKKNVFLTMLTRIAIGLLTFVLALPDLTFSSFRADLSTSIHRVFFFRFRYISSRDEGFIVSFFLPLSSHVT